MSHWTKEYQTAIREAYEIPDHIADCAKAIAYDLNYGPSWSLIPHGDITQFNMDCVANLQTDLLEVFEPGDALEETYTGQVADALRDFLDNLPSELWVDTDCACVMTKEPDAYEEIEVEIEDEDGELLVEMQSVPVDMSAIWHVERTQIIEALFGRTIAREFQ